MCRATALLHKGENMLGEFIANVFSPLFLSPHVRIAVVPLLAVASVPSGRSIESGDEFDEDAANCPVLDPVEQRDFHPMGFFASL